MFELENLNLSIKLCKFEYCLIYGVKVKAIILMKVSKSYTIHNLLWYTFKVDKTKWKFFVLVKIYNIYDE